MIVKLCHKLTNGEKSYMTFKVKINKKILIIYVIMGGCVLSCLILPGMLTAGIAIVVACYIAVIEKNTTKLKKSQTNSLILCIPVLLAAFQNVYLAIGISHQTALSLQIMLSLHFFLVLIVDLMNAQILFSKVSKIVWLIVIVIIQGTILYLAYPAPITSLISAGRNVLSCLVIYAYSCIIGENSDEKTYYKILNAVALIVVMFGLFEYIGGINIWRNLGITQLWNLKGITTNAAGVPMNWFSSETIGGQQIRRMVSSFADPVNLGTYLFAAFMISWYTGNNVLTVLLSVCCILTISKGALLGFLVFVVMYVWFKDKSKIGVPIIFFLCTLFALRFVEYSMTKSTGSMMAHIGGFISSLKLLITNPAGLGIGNVGVLSGLFSTSLSNTDVIETGIGVIIAQLGWVGLLCYISFFLYLFYEPRKWKLVDMKASVMYYTLLFAFILNALFNEVALSPNSCALYFIELAYLNIKMKYPQKREAITK